MNDILSVPYIISPDESQRRTKALAPLLDKVREGANGNNSLAGSTESPDLALEHYVQQVWNIPAVLTVNSENATLEIVLTAAGVSDGTCVIMSALASKSMIATVNALGAEACLVDIDEATMTIDPSAVFQSINACTRAIIASHVCGFPPDMRKLMQMAGQYGISVIEDATWAVGGQYGGVRYSGQAVGSVGDYGYITCSPGKPLMTMHAAGMIFCRDPQECERLRSLRDQGQQRLAKQGWECMNPYDALLLRIELERLSSWFDRRKQISILYSEAFTTLPFDGPPDFPSCVVSPYPLVTRSTGEREALVQCLIDERVIATHLNVLPALGGHHENLHYECARMPIARSVIPRLVYLPNVPELSDGEVERCIELVSWYFQTSRTFRLSPTISLVLNSEQRSLAALTDEGCGEHQFFEPDELSLVTVLLEAYPGYCPYSRALVLFSSQPEGTCEELVRQAFEQGTFDDLIRPVRQVLSRCRRKVGVLGVDITGILETGYLMIPG